MNLFLFSSDFNKCMQILIPTNGECGKIGCKAEKKTCHNKINDKQEM